MEQPIQDRFGQLLKWQNKGALILNTRFEPFLRRLLDILGALFGLLFLSPVFIFIAYWLVNMC